MRAETAIIAALPATTFLPFGTEVLAGAFAGRRSVNAPSNKLNGELGVF